LRTTGELLAVYAAARKLIEERLTPVLGKFSDARVDLKDSC
jgi:hypothetical protein